MAAYSIEMDFYTDLGETYRLVVNRANPDTTASDIKEIMELLLDKGELIITSAGMLSGIKSASLVQRESVNILEEDA